MDDRQSLAFDKLMKDQKKKKATLLTIVLVAAVLVFLLGLLFGIAISSNALAVPAGAEEVAREDFGSLQDNEVQYRSSSNPDYVLESSGLSLFASWLRSNSYTSSSNLYRFSDPCYMFNGSGFTFTSYTCYVSGYNNVVFVSGSNEFHVIASNGYTFGFDSPSNYHFLRYDVGLGSSDFVVRGFDQPIAVAEDTVGSFFVVGDKLLAFVTDNVLVLIPLVLFLGVFAFGSIKRLITGV